jgi:hypothetical protein
MLLAALLSATVAQTPAPSTLVRTATLSVRAQVAATCRISSRETACRDAAPAAPLSRRYDAAGGGRLIIEF